MIWFHFHVDKIKLLRLTAGKTQTGCIYITQELKCLQIAKLGITTLKSNLENRRVSKNVKYLTQVSAPI